ncbi:MAG TPA: YetF domain-containing protein [Saliniramus sp.]|nr:YetF domain-containing protein [Saliniramus sp.]
MGENPLFFDDWSSLGRILIVGILAYLALVAILRISGKRTLTKLNAFDLVVTVALGSTLATILLNKEVTLAEGVLALSPLIGLQYVITWLSVRAPSFQHMVKAEPTMLAHGGQFLDDALRRQRITREEVVAALRSSGMTEISQAATVILETDGSISVIGKSG